MLACVGAGGRADETPEVPVQLALIVEPDSLRDFARLHACRQELLRAHDAQPREVGMRWQADFRSEGAAQVELVGAGVVGKRVERHLGIEAVAQVLDRAAHCTRLLAPRALDGCERQGRLGDRDLQGQPTRTGLHCVVQALERRAARIPSLEMRMDADVVV